SAVIASTAIIFTTDQWAHFAVVREADGETLRGYVDGTQVFVTTDNRTLDSVCACSVGGNSAGGQLLSGYIDDLEMIKGVCLHPNGTPFTPPIGPFQG